MPKLITWPHLVTTPIGRKGQIGGVDTFPLLTDLISFWELEEASGTREDAHSTNDLTDNNTVTQAAGKVGNAASFAIATSEFLSRADNAALSTGDIDYTLCAWVNATTLGADRGMIARDDGSAGTREYGIIFDNTTSRFRFVIFSGTSSVGSVSANNLGAPATTTWYFIVAWHDAAGNTVNIQVDNGTADSAATTGAPADTAAPFWIGHRASTFWNGLIDQVGFWKRVLTAAERTWLYNAGNGRTYAEIAAYTG